MKTNWKILKTSHSPKNSPKGPAIESTSEPNTLCISILQARKLVSSNVRVKPHAVVKIRCGRLTFATAPCREATNDPKISKKFFLPKKKLEDKIQVEVGNYRRGRLLDEMIGEVSFDSAGILKKLEASNDCEVQGGFYQSWHSLSTKKLIASRLHKPAFAGEILIKFSLVAFDGDADFAANDTDDDGEIPLFEDDAFFSTSEIVQEEERLKLDEKKALEKLEAIDEGDYNINIHIMEARDIKHADDIPTQKPSPSIHIDCFGKHFSTNYLKAVSNAIFDEHISFKIPQATHHRLMQGGFNIHCVDASSKSQSLAQEGRATGSWQCDFSYIYLRPGHEIWKEWITLSRTESALGSDQGADSEMEEKDFIRGFVLISISIVGPHDTAVVHNETAPKVPPLPYEVSIFTPQMKTQLRFLSVVVHKVEDLPAMDHVGFQKRGVDAKVRVDFGSECKEAVTKIVTRQGTDEFFSFDIDQEVLVPFVYPTANNRVVLSIWDDDIGRPDEIIATTQAYSLELIRKYPAPHQGFWVNLYGAPLPATTPTDASTGMNTGNCPASTYRGRVLVSMREINGGTRKVPHTVVVRPSHTPVPLPEQEPYQLVMHLYSGSHLPFFSVLSNKMKICLTWGRHCETTEPAINKGGIITWTDKGGCLKFTAQFPKEVEHSPTIFVYLNQEHLIKSTITGADSNICYLSLSPKDIFVKNAQGLKAALTPKWYNLKADPALNVVDKATFPGSLLMGIALAKPETFAEVPSTAISWPPKLVYQSYRLNLYLFSGRALMPSDSSGSLDPYVTILFAGKTMQSEHKVQTRAPIWNQMFSFDAELPEDHTYMPRVILKVMDRDFLDTDDFTGNTFVEINNSTTVFQDGPALKEIVPKWYPVWFQTEGDSAGELLLGLELIKRDSSTSHFKPQFPHIEHQEYQLHVLALGLKEIKGSPKKPLVEIRLENNSGVVITTKTSNTPRPENCFFGEYHSKTISLPASALYAPCINIAVREGMMGLGSASIIYGQASVSLERKMPLSNGAPNPEYEEPFSNRVNLSSPFEEVFVPQTRIGRRLKTDVPPPGLYSMKGQSSLMVNDFMEAQYLQDRDMFPDDLEHIIHSPFELYPIFSGNANQVGSNSLMTYRCTGMFKGIIMLSHKEDKRLENMFKELEGQRRYTARLYLLTAHLVAPPRHGRPFVKVSLGSVVKQSKDTKALVLEEELEADPDFDLEGVVDQSISPARAAAATGRLKKIRQSLKQGARRDLTHHTTNMFAKEDISNGRFCVFFCEEFENIQIPGVPQLRIQLKDQHNFAANELLGETVIDLEDRWFSREWKELGAEYNNGDGVSHKPIENRALWVPTSQTAQGSIQMWLEIFPQELVQDYPKIDIKAPTPAEYEVRLIIHKARMLPPPDDDEDYVYLPNYLVKAWIGKSKPFATDVHKEVRKGSASYNKLAKFTKMLPSEGFGEARLYVQAWEKGSGSGDFCVGEGMKDLSAAFANVLSADGIVDCFSGDRARSNSSNHKASEPRMEDSEQGGMEGLVFTIAGTALGNQLSQAGVEEEKGSSVHTPLLASGVKAAFGATKQALTPKLNRARSIKQARLKKRKTASYMKSMITKLLDLEQDPEGGIWLPVFGPDKSGNVVKSGEILLSCTIMSKEVAENTPSPVLPKPWGRPPEKMAELPITMIRNVINDPSFTMMGIYAALGCLCLSCSIILVYFGLTCLAVWVVMKK